MSLREYHLPESEYQIDGRLERLVETLSAIRVEGAGRRGEALDQKLAIYNSIQLSTTTAQRA